MAVPITINTGKYIKDGKVSVDGMIWKVIFPGAAREMKLMQAQRRLQLLDKKIKNETVTEEDLDKYDRYEETVFQFFKNLFRDDTKDNSQVNKWIAETPLAVIGQAFEDIKEAREKAAQTSGVSDGQPEQTTSS